MIVFRRLWSAQFSTWKIVTLFQIFGDMGICARRTFLPTLHSEDSAGRRFEILLFYWLILCDWQESNWDGILCQSGVFLSREGYEWIWIKSSSLILKTSLKVMHLVESLSYYVRYDWSILIGRNQIITWFLKIPNLQPNQCMITLFFLGYDVCWIVDKWHRNYLWYFTKTGEWAKNVTRLIGTNFCHRNVYLIFLQPRGWCLHLVSEGFRDEAGA